LSEGNIVSHAKMSQSCVPAITLHCDFVKFWTPHFLLVNSSVFCFNSVRLSKLHLSYGKMMSLKVTDEACRCPCDTILQ